jgi:hypothetical protein
VVESKLEPLLESMDGSTVKLQKKLIITHVSNRFFKEIFDSGSIEDPLCGGGYWSHFCQNIITFAYELALVWACTSTTSKRECAIGALIGWTLLVTICFMILSKTHNIL